jgi:cytochrome P450
VTESRCPVVNFDHNSQQHADAPAASYRVLRTAAPVASTEAHGGYWVLSDYASVFDAAKNHQVFSSARSTYGGEGLSQIIPKKPAHLMIPIELDPPEFRTFRKILNPKLSPSALELLRPKIDYYTTWLIDQVIERGECNFSEVIGVPSMVIVDVMGLDLDDWKRYASAFHSTLDGIPGSPAFIHAVEVDFPYLYEKKARTIAERRAEPKDDMISYLLEQEIDGRPITDFEVQAITENLLSGGTGTTTALSSMSLVWLYEHQDVRRTLIKDPGKLERAIEEFLRYFSPVQALARTVTKDIDFHGCPISVGDRVLLAWSSANRDPAEFENPDEIDIDRSPNRHVAFGAGIHRCVGSHMGRLMARSILGEILSRMPDYTVDVTAVQRFPEQGTNIGYQSIPARFTPGPRVLPADARPQDFDLRGGEFA